MENNQNHNYLSDSDSEVTVNKLLFKEVKRVGKRIGENERKIEETEARINTRPNNIEVRLNGNYVRFNNQDAKINLLSEQSIQIQNRLDKIGRADAVARPIQESI